MMKKRMMLVVLVLSMFLVANSYGTWQPLSWDILYDGSLLPDTHDASGYALQYSGVPTDWFNSNYSANMTTNATDGDIYHMSTIDADGGAWWNMYFGSAPEVDRPDSSVGYTVEIRAKLNTGQGIGNYAAFTFEESTPGVDRYWEFKMVESLSGTVSAAIGSTSTPVYQTIDHNWHTYRITAEDDGIRLYIDGSTVAADHLAAFRSLGSNQLRFGDFTGEFDGDWELDYVGVYVGGAVVPEPVSVLLLGLGGLIAWRRKRQG